MNGVGKGWFKFTYRTKLRFIASLRTWCHVQSHAGIKANTVNCYDVRYKMIRPQQVTYMGYSF